MILTFGFAWAMGGEKHFGKWRRGALVLIPIVIHGIFAHMSRTYFACQFAAAYLIYQALFYDMCIQAVYDPPSPPHQQMAGLVGLFINGLFVSVQPIVYLIFTDQMGFITEVALICGLGFLLIAWLSNRWKITIPFWKFRDSWFLSCFIYGMILGLCFLF